MVKFRGEEGLDYGGVARYYNLKLKLVYLVYHCNRAFLGLYLYSKLKKKIS